MLVKITLKNLADLCVHHNYDFDESYKSVVGRDKNDLLTMDTASESFPHVLKEAATKDQLEKLGKQLSIGDGVGTELKSLLSNYLGIQTTAGCSCLKRAKEMNVKGVEWCALNKDLIAEWLREESKKKRMPFVKAVALTLITVAIWKYRRKIS